MSKKGKRYRAAMEMLQQIDGPVGVAEAAELVKKTASAKFDESVDLDVRLGVDPRHADQMVRGTVALPHGTGKDVRVLVLASEGKQQVDRLLAVASELEPADISEIWADTIGNAGGGACPATSENMLQLTPLRDKTDGFFIAVFQARLR